MIHSCLQASAGIMMNLMCIMLLQFSINTYGYALFNLGEFPSWASGPMTATNMTTIPPGMANFTLGQ